MEPLSRRMRLPKQTLAVPPLEQLMSWPDELQQQAAKAGREQLESELSELQERMDSIRAQIESGETLPKTTWDILTEQWRMRTDPDVLDGIDAARIQREQASKGIILTCLDNVGLQDGGAVQSQYMKFVDLDMAGGYNEVHDVALHKQDGVYLLSHQLTYDNGWTASGTTRSQLTPTVTRLLIHEELARPLEFRQAGVTENLSEVVIADTIPTKWEYVDEEVREWTEAMRTDKLIEQILPLLPAECLRTMVGPSGRVSEDELSTNRAIPIGPTIEVDLSAIYYRHFRHDREHETLDLDHIDVRLKMGGQVKERYSLDQRSLEICSYDTSYDHVGNLRLHDSAEALLAMAMAAIDKTMDNTGRES